MITYIAVTRNWSKESIMFLPQGINLKALLWKPGIFYIRAFFIAKITGFKRFLPVSLKRWMKNEYHQSRLCRHLTPCTMRKQPFANIEQFKMVVTQRVMAFFASCEQFRYSKRFDSWNGNIMYLNALHGRWL